MQTDMEELSRENKRRLDEFTKSEEELKQAHVKEIETKNAELDAQSKEAKTVLNEMKKKHQQEVKKLQIENDQHFHDFQNQSRKQQQEYERKLAAQKTNVERELYNRFLQVQAELQESKEKHEKEKDTWTQQSE